MSTLTVTPTYVDGVVLTEADLDDMISDIETHFNNANVAGSNIQANILTGSLHLDNTAVTTAKLASNSVIATKLEDATSTTTGITSAKVLADNVTTAKLETSSSSSTGVTTAKIADSNITTAKINTNAVPKGVMLSIPSSEATLTDTTVAVVDNDDYGSLTLVGQVVSSGLTTGKPNIINLQSTSTTSGSGYISLTFTSGSAYVGRANIFSMAANLHLYKDGVLLYRQSVMLGDFYHADGGATQTAYLRLPLSTCTFIDNDVTTSSHTYALYLQQATAPCYLAYPIFDYTTPIVWSTGYIYRTGTIKVIGAKLITMQVV